MHGLLMMVLQEHGAEAGGGSALFSINTGVSLWTLIIFFLLLLVLTKYAWGPILGAVESRERRIQEILDAAARDREEAERGLEEQRRQLAQARQEAQQILAEGKQAGERVREDILAKARAEQEHLLERAKQEIEREKDLAVQALRAEAVDLSLAAASKLIETRLGSEEDRRLIEDYLTRFDASAGVGPAPAGGNGAS